MNDLIKSAKEIIIESYEISKKPCIMFSGGKDSTVILHLIRSIRPDQKALFLNTGVEAPETLEYCKTINNLDWVTPDIDFWTLCEKYGFPDFKGSKGNHDGNKCCVYLKKKPAQKYQDKHNIDLLFLGLTSSESRQRMMLFKRLEPVYFAKTESIWKSNPIWNWTEKDVWEYIKENNIPYNKGYDIGWKRCGCVPCSAHLKWQQRLSKEDPKMLRLLLQKKYGQKQCIDF